MTLQEVVAVARAGRRAGCTEVLFTLGERPEQRYPKAKEWLRIHGYGTTLEYLHDAAKTVLDETGLLPHLNPGTMSRREIAMLRPVSASMGLMLENVSSRLAQPGGPHQQAPSKRPRARLKTLQLAGKENVAFTSGLLIGIGENREEIIDSLLAIRELQSSYRHIQEVIIQNFRAKPNTPMSLHPDACLEEMLWAVSVSRLVLGPRANIQVPPNLNTEDYAVYLLAGINDWGGVSPVTADYVNPEAPWPHLHALRERTEDLGFTLRARLPLYPEYLMEERGLVSPAIRDSIRSLADEQGFAKEANEYHARTF
jgi:FO synthase